MRQTDSPTRCSQSEAQVWSGAGFADTDIVFEMSAQLYPLSPLQQGMLYHALAEPCSGVDVEQLVVRLRESVDAGRLTAAWQRVIARHEVLRISFQWDGAAPMQEIHEVVDVPLRVEESVPDFTEWLQSDRQRGFAMDRPPLMRLTLFKRAEDDWTLAWTFHHALLDGRSITIVLDEVFRFYDTPQSAEPPLPPPFREFIAWQSTRLPEGSEGFWRDKLRGFRATTPLTVEGMEGCSATRAQGEAQLRLDLQTTDALRALADNLGVTLNTLVQGAWAILLARYSGEEDVCFGATRACRHSTIEGADSCVGLMINTVPIRTAVGAGTSLADFLRALRQQWVDIREHEHTPLSRIQAWSELPQGQPLFHTLVVFENYDLPAQFRSRGGAWERRELSLHEQTNFPVCIAAYAGRELRLVAEFDRSRLDEGTIGRMLGHLATILSAIPESRTIGDVPLISPAEREGILAVQNGAPLPADPRDEKTLHALFAERAALQPDAVALVQNDERLTYRQLDDRANAVAAHLAASGVAAGEIVGLCMERCPALVVALLGILKAGAAYLPIDLAYPAERLAFMLADAKAPVLLTQRHLAERLPVGHGARLVFIEDIALSAPAPGVEGAPEQWCYVLYTSGSTGKPKGCCITHRNVVRLFTSTELWFHFTRDDVWTLFHSTAFDFSVWEIWGALLYGGTLVVVPFETSRSPELFHELLVTEKVTVLSQTPSAFRQLIAADGASSRAHELSLRTVVFGGEALEMQSLRPWFERHGDTKPQLVNMYGITETTVHVTYRPLSASDLTRGSVIGEAIPDLQIYILDPQFRPVPIGVPGELFVGGAGLAQKYLHRPELTKERFIASPFRDGERLYRTGDLARWLANRDIEYLGRIDQQVKIRGFRIELGEIESHLLSHAGVREASVLARDSAGGKRLIAWFVPDGAAPGAAELRAHLKAFVPDYMVPAAFVPLVRMPLTNNGKLDHRALPEPAEERPDVASKFVAPSTDAERALAEIWQRLLKIERVGIHDNFFELGGDSILSILVVTQARTRGIAITPKLLFDHPTIAELASQGATGTVRIAELPATGSVPLTPVQRWFFDHQFADAHHWNQSFAFRLTRPVSRERLLDAIGVVLHAHPVFRLQFDEHGRQSFGEVPRAEIIEHADAVSVQASLSLTGPLVRFAMLDAETLLIAIHHLIVDGVSWRILLEDLDCALRGERLPSATTGFHTWAAALPAALKGAECEREFWLDVARSETPTLPVDHQRGENTEASSDTFFLRFSADETTQLLHKLPAGFRTHELLLSGLADALRKWTGSKEFTIETEGHGREESALKELSGHSGAYELSRTIGWFTTIFPLRLRSGELPGDTQVEVSRSLRNVPHHGFGYSLLRHLSPDGAALASRAEVLFNYLGQFDHTVAGLQHFGFSNADTGPWHAPAAHRTHLLEINALVINDALEVRFAYSRNLHRKETIAALADHFAFTVRTLVSRKYPLARLSPDAIEALVTSHPNLEDIYPLSPMQRLFLAVETARPGSGSDQWHCRLIGPINPDALLAAWKQVAARHPALRCGYTSDGAEPHQFVLNEALPVVRFEDLTALAPAQQQSRFDELLASDAAKPFDLLKPPLTRFVLLKVAEDEHRLVWTHHHLEIDGWSWPLVLKELSMALENGLAAQPPAPPYRDYIAQLTMRDSRKAESFWRALLAGFRTSTILPLAGANTPDSQVSIALDAALTANINRTARNLKATVNTIVQCAWAALLAHHAGTDDVVIGASFSGRPADLAGADRIVGHFVNNLPVRVRVTPDTALAGCVNELHRELSQIAEHQTTSLSDIQGWSDLPWTARLFETLVVFQNYLTDGASDSLGAARIVDLHSPVRTNYPLTLVIVPGAELRLTLIANANVGEPANVRALAEQLAALLSAACEAPERPLAQLTAGFSKLRNSPSAPSVASAPLAPASSRMEAQIAAIWSEAFGRAVSTTDNFFDIGGHSLLMLRVHSRLVSELGREIPVVKLFQYSTIRSLAQYLGGGAETSNVADAARDRAAKARAAMAQRRVPPRPTL